MPHFDLFANKNMYIGIKGLTRKAWETAALSTDTQLNISVVIDCVDKQDVSLARRLFGLDVEQCMLESGIYRDEAPFCRLISGLRPRTSHQFLLQKDVYDGWNFVNGY